MAMAISPLVPAAFADAPSLQSVLFNVNGSQYIDYSVPGINTGGWDASTGLGTLTLVFDPGAPGTYFFDVFFDHGVAVPFFNEYGFVNGAPGAGQTYEIGDSFASNIYPDVQAGGDLPNTNNLPGTSSNFNLSCSDPTCNGDAALAMGFGFTLGTDEEALITLQTSLTNPGGFNLEQIHPVDDANRVESLLFLNGNVVIQPSGPPPTVPEPGSWVLLGTACAIALGTLRRRLSGNQAK